MKRQELMQQVRLLQQVASRLALRSPDLFRRNVYLNDEADRACHQALLPFQMRDLQQLDPMWLELSGVQGTDNPFAVRRPGDVRRAYLERPRGHSKTTDTALQLVWILMASRRSLNGLAAAADLEQACLIQRAMQRFLHANRHLTISQSLKFVGHTVRNVQTGSLLKFVSSDVRGSWGELPDFVICDELCHWRTPDLWQSLLSSAAKRPRSVLVVLSNAGQGHGWQWDVREQARTDPGWYFSSLDGPQAPWITGQSLDEQRRLLPPAVFARLWLNRWQHSDGEFVSLAEASACCDSGLVEQSLGTPNCSYLAVVDYAEKRDLTVGCLCHREGGMVIIDRMDVVRPSPDRPTPVRWVSDWIEEMSARFPGVRFVLDEHQLASVIQSLQDRYPVTRFRFQAGRANHEMAMLLRQLILERQVRWYPGCGLIPGEEDRLPADDLQQELASLIVREQPGGRFRFDHRQDGRHHDDRAFALGAACLSLMNEPEELTPWLEVTPPEQSGFLEGLFGGGAHFGGDGG